MDQKFVIEPEQSIDMPMNFDVDLLEVSLGILIGGTFGSLSYYFFGLTETKIKKENFVKIVSEIFK